MKRYFSSNQYSLLKNCIENRLNNNPQSMFAEIALKNEEMIDKANKVDVKQVNDIIKDQQDTDNIMFIKYYLKQIQNNLPSKNYIYQIIDLSFQLISNLNLDKFQSNLIKSDLSKIYAAFIIQETSILIQMQINNYYDTLRSNKIINISSRINIMVGDFIFGRMSVMLASLNDNRITKLASETLANSTKSQMIYTDIICDNNQFNDKNKEELSKNEVEAITRYQNLRQITQLENLLASIVFKLEKYEIKDEDIIELKNNGDEVIKLLILNLVNNKPTLRKSKVFDQLSVYNNSE